MRNTSDLQDGKRRFNNGGRGFELTDLVITKDERVKCYVADCPDTFLDGDEMIRHLPEHSPRIRGKGIQCPLDDCRIWLQPGGPDKQSVL